MYSVTRVLRERGLGLNSTLQYFDNRQFHEGKGECPFFLVLLISTIGRQVFDNYFYERNKKVSVSSFVKGNKINRR